MGESAWDIITQIDEEELAGIILKLTDYADIKARTRRWKTGNHENLPQGNAPEDIAFEAITRFLSGDRKWNQDRYPCILDFLKSVVDSLISHLINSQDHKSMEYFPEDINGNPQESILGQQQSISLPTQEIELLSDERIGQIYKAIGGDVELQAIMDAIMQGYIKPRDLAEITGINVKRVNQLKRTLDRMSHRLDEAL